MKSFLDLPGDIIGIICEETGSVTKLRLVSKYLLKQTQEYFLKRATRISQPHIYDWLFTKPFLKNIQQYLCKYGSTIFNCLLDSSGNNSVKYGILNHVKTDSYEFDDAFIKLSDYEYRYLYTTHYGNPVKKNIIVLVLIPSLCNSAKFYSYVAPVLSRLKEGYNTMSNCDLKNMEYIFQDRGINQSEIKKYLIDYNNLVKTSSPTNIYYIFYLLINCIIFDLLSIEAFHKLLSTIHDIDNIESIAVQNEILTLDKLLVNHLLGLPG